NLRNGGAEPDALGRLGNGSQRGPGVVPGLDRIGPVDQVIRQHDGVETERFRPSRTAEHLGPVGGGDDQDVETHRLCHGRNHIGMVMRAAVARILSIRSPGWRPDEVQPLYIRQKTDTEMRNLTTTANPVYYSRTTFGNDK